MLLAEDTPLGVEHFLLERLRSMEVALRSKDRGKIVHRRECPRMLPPERLKTYFEHLLLYQPSSLGITLRPYYRRESAHRLKCLWPLLTKILACYLDYSLLDH